MPSIGVLATAAAVQPVLGPRQAMPEAASTRSSQNTASPPRCDAQAPTVAALARRPPATLLHPLVQELNSPLERGYLVAGLSKDKLSKQQQEYHCNVGAALRALQEDLPAVLERQPDLSVFSEGVVFEDNLSPRLGLPACSCTGKEAYGRLMWSLRFHSALFFCKSRVELQRVWEKQPGVVCVRWTARAAPRLLDGLIATASATITLDGVSEFHFSDAGRICKHSVDCVSYCGPQLQLQVPLLARYARRHALRPGLAGGSWDDC